MPKKEIYSCEICGRDTTCRNRICAKCRGAFGHDEESRGRKSRYSRSLGSSPFEESKEPDDRTTGDEYHGDSVRDDI